MHDDAPGSCIANIPDMSLSALPPELVEIIFRHLCTTKAPPFLSTPSSITSAFSLALCHSSHLEVFKSLLSHISAPPERFREDSLPQHPRAGVILEGIQATDASHLAAVIRLSHHYLTQLHLSVKPKEPHWVAALTPAPRLLKVLSLRDVTPQYPLVPLLHAVGAQLSDLRIAGTTGVALSQAQINSIGHHARNLERLTLRLSVFEHNWRPLWHGVGGTLKHLSIGATRFWIMDSDEDLLLTLVSANCPHVTSLHFFHVGASLGQGVSDICARYGAQLENLTLEQCQVHRPHLFRIQEHCPNVMVDVLHGSSFFSHSYNIDVIDIFAPRLGSLCYRTQLSHDESLFDLRRCANLKALRLDCASTLSEQVLRGIVTAVGKSLKELSLSFFVRPDNGDLVQDTLDWLREHAPGLETLRIGAPGLAMDRLERLLRETGIRELEITFGLHSPREFGNVEAVVGLMKVVAATVEHRKGLECVIVNHRGIGEVGRWRERVRLACLRLRGRIGRVSVCGVEFV